MRNIFSIFTESTNSFPGQEAGEDVVLLLRRHPFFIIVKIIICIILILVPLGVVLYFSEFLFSMSLLQLSLFLISFWTLILWQVIFYHLTMYTLDVWIVTDRRIIDSTQHGFFNRTISELHMTRIQDISVHVDGLMQSLFRFGDLRVQTAGTEENFKFIQIPRPEEVKNKIMQMSHSVNGGHEAGLAMKKVEV